MRIWFASSTVIVLIILLALTVNHAREQDMVALFGRQQLAYVQNISERLVDVLNQLEKDIKTFSRSESLDKNFTKRFMMSTRYLFRL